MYSRQIWTWARRAIVPLACATAMTTALGASGAATAASPRALHRAVPLAGQPGGDIPDSAVYLRYQSRGFSLEYVEGWLQTTTAHGVIFNDKDSAVVVELRPRVTGSLVAYVRQVDLPRLARADGFRRGALVRDAVGGYPALRLVYQGRSAPDTVTGKTVVLQTDRYYIAGPRALAILTLATPLGIDNADGFRRIAHSFRFH